MQTAAGLRREVYGKGDPSRADLEMLIADGAALGADPDFSELLAEVATDVLVRQGESDGFVSDEAASWLIDRVGKAEGLSVAAKFAMLRAIVGHAVSIPASLTGFGLAQIKTAILKGAPDHAPGVVDSRDVEALRALAFAPTAACPVHVDRSTAEMLFDIAHATAGADNDPAFADFFAKAVGNYLMGACFLEPPDAAKSRAVEKEFDRVTSRSYFLSSLASRPNLSQLGDALESEGGEEEDETARENDDADRRLAAAAPVDADEAAWVIAHLTKGSLSPAERRLLAFLREEAPSAPPALAALFDQAA